MLRRNFYACFVGGFLAWPTVWAAAHERPHRLPLPPPLPAPCFEACQWAVRPLLFNDTAGLSPNPRVRSCQSTLDLTSLYLCTRMYCDIGQRIAGLDVLNTTCHGSVQVSIPPYEDLMRNYTDEDAANVRRVSQAEWDGAAIFDEAVIASDELFALLFDTLVCICISPSTHYLGDTGLIIQLPTVFLGLCLQSTHIVWVSSNVLV